MVLLDQGDDLPRSGVPVLELTKNVDPEVAPGERALEMVEGQ